MAAHGRFTLVADVEGHASGNGREIEVSKMKLDTADGELTLEPEDESGERWKVVEGPDDLIGHGFTAEPLAPVSRRRAHGG